MLKKYSLSLIIISFLYTTSLLINALTYDKEVVNSLKEYEQNIVDYANGNDWFSNTSVEYGDMGAYDDTYEEPELFDNKIEPLGKLDIDEFSYYTDLESDMYYQVYETDTNIYFVQWNVKDLSRPSLIEYYSK